MSDKYYELNQIINESRHIVFFGGAGVSTESGIPDFRSKEGLYNNLGIEFEQYSPEYLLSHECLYYNSKVFYEFYRQKMNVLDIMPNDTHYKLALMEEKEKLDCIITQNIDGLHQKAGSKKVYEIHGTVLHNYCDRCLKRYPSDYLFKNNVNIPLCNCGGMIRPDVVLYGETLPAEAYRQAINVIEQADCLIIGGTSLNVYPAAGMIDYFKGKYLILINKDRTARDTDASLVFHESIGYVMNQIII